ncbi:hypothetical protein AOLI_G00288400 [Acnodon oligacanthus]
MPQLIDSGNTSETESLASNDENEDVDSTRPSRVGDVRDEEVPLIGREVVVETAHDDDQGRKMILFCEDPYANLTMKKGYPVPLYSLYSCGLY